MGNDWLQQLSGEKISMSFIVDSFMGKTAGCRFGQPVGYLW
jgi:hypothetical protein